MFDSLTPAFAAILAAKAADIRRAAAARWRFNAQRGRRRLGEERLGESPADPDQHLDGEQERYRLPA